MRWIACACAAIALGLITPTAAFAHDDILGASPNNGAQMTRVPEEVRVEFAEPPTSGFGSIAGPAGQALRDGEAKVIGTELVIPIRPDAGLGGYEVEFRATSTDGHPITGTLSFEVIQQATTDSTPGAPSPEATSKVGAARMQVHQSGKTAERPPGSGLAQREGSAWPSSVYCSPAPSPAREAPADDPFGIYP